MKKFIAICVMAITPTLGLAQTSGSVSGSASQAQAAAGANSASGSYAGYTVNNYNSGKNQVEYQGAYDINNVPNVSAPAVFGGGHPCLAGQSGGLSVLGGGASYGRGDAEPICMLWLMNQPEAAIRLLVMQNEGACKALGNVGYYRVGNKVIPFECGKTTKGGVDTPGVVSTTTRVSTRNQLWTKCSYDAANNKIVVKFTAEGRRDKVAAGQACKRSLGY